mgnify:CR=1 FL=1
MVFLVENLENIINENGELIMKVEFRNGEPLSEISGDIEELYLEINEERKKNQEILWKRILLSIL